MTNIVHLNQPKSGDTTFMRCPCTDEGTDFLVVAIMADNPIICGLLCPECEQEIPVVNGVIGAIAQ
jgi:hypothetical protein